MLRPTGLIGATAVAACFNGGDIGMFVGGCRSGAGSLPRLQDWIMPYLPETAAVYHRYPRFAFMNASQMVRDSHRRTKRHTVFVGCEVTEYRGGSVSQGMVLAERGPIRFRAADRRGWDGCRDLQPSGARLGGRLTAAHQNARPPLRRSDAGPSAASLAPPARPVAACRAGPPLPRQRVGDPDPRQSAPIRGSLRVNPAPRTVSAGWRLPSSVRPPGLACDSTDCT